MAPFQMTRGMRFSVGSEGADSAVGALLDEIGARLDVDAVIEDGVAAASRARRIRGRGKTAPGRRVVAALPLLCSGCGRASGVAAPAFAVPAGKGTGRRAAGVYAGACRPRAP